MEKQRWEESEKRREEERRSENRKSKKKEDAGARKGRKVAIHCGSGESKSRLAKAAGAEPFGQMRDEKLHALVARSTFRSQNAENTSCSGHFWKLRCRKSARHCVAKQISKSNVENTSRLEHFWKLRCRKSARRCGVKQISKSKCRKHHMFGPLLEIRMWKKCKPLWHKAHLEVKMAKKKHVRTGPFLDIQPRQTT